MSEFLEKVVKMLAGVGGAILGLFGGWNPLLTVLCAFMAMDYLTGIIVGLKGKSPKTKDGRLSSKASFDGLLKKALIMLIVLMAALLDHAIGNHQTLFSTATVCFYIANEGMSITENVSILGVSMPSIISKALDLFKRKSENGDTKEDKNESK